MKVKIVTALFDINREDKGDGRRIEEYLEWFKYTLKLKCDFVIYTEERFKDFVNEIRKDIEYNTDIIIQKIDEIPFYKNREKIKNIIESDYYKSKINDINRIECYLPEYNIIQYSKFGWLKKTIQDHNEYEYFIWMDAGCSRFFNGHDYNREWPSSKLPTDKLTIQGNSNYVSSFESMDPDKYIWDNNSMLVGTLFGGGRDVVIEVSNLIEEKFNKLIDINCVNNEQFLLAITAKTNPDLFNIIVKLDYTHLPLFKIIS